MPKTIRPLPPISEKSIARFFSLVRRGEPEECWEWTGGRVPAGYGQYSYTHSHPVGTHRIAYFLEFHVDPVGLEVCHTCDNPPCCNPAHLFLGTSADNARDRDAKGRGFSWFREHPELIERGEQRYNAKLTDEKFKLIASMYSAGHTHKSIAATIGVSRGTVGGVVRGRAWKSSGAQFPPRKVRRPGLSGLKHPCSRFCAEDIPRIRAMRQSGMLVSTIAAAFSVNEETIRAILKGRRYADL